MDIGSSYSMAWHCAGSATGAPTAPGRSIADIFTATRTGLHETPGAGTLQGDGTRVAGRRVNDDGSVTRIDRPRDASYFDSWQLRPDQRLHEVGDGTVQLISGSTLRPAIDQPGLDASEPASDDSGRSVGDLVGANNTGIHLAPPQDGGVPETFESQARSAADLIGVNNTGIHLPRPQGDEDTEAAGARSLLDGIRLPVSNPDAGSLQADGSRVPGTRVNPDGSITDIGPVRNASLLESLVLRPDQRLHEVGDGTVQLITGSTLLPAYEPTPAPVPTIAPTQYRGVKLT